jgi:multiple sugar transport system ATP-binding protein
VTYVHVRLGADIVVVSVPPHARLAPNQPIWLAFDQEKIHLFDAATGSALAAS